MTDPTRDRPADIDFGPGALTPPAFYTGPTIDRPALLLHLAHGESRTRSPLVQAIYAGLVDRIRRGDFDREEPA